MPLLFSYGTLQLVEVQLSTLGRRLEGRRDELVGFETSRIPIEDPEVVAATGNTHHANVIPTEKADRRVPGMVFEVTEAELERTDRYEAQFSYERASARLASGGEAWVYYHSR
jgi:hypothetical protein